MTSQKCLIERMLTKINSSRSSMELQIADMTDVLDKSNNALLQIEASRSIKPTINDPNAVPFTFNKETVNALARIVDKCIHLLTARGSAPSSDSGCTSIEDYMETAGLRSEYLACNIRKLLAVWDVVQQMRIILQRQEMELDGNGEVITLLEPIIC